MGRSKIMMRLARSRHLADWGCEPAGVAFGEVGTSRWDVPVRPAVGRNGALSYRAS